MIAWLTANWEWVLLVVFVLEKIVKMSPAKWDDIIVDGVKAILKALTGKKD